MRCRAPAANSRPCWCWGSPGLILAEIFCRTVLNISLSFAWEYAAYCFAVSIFLAAAFALRTGGYVRVMLLSQSVSPRVEYWLDVVATVAGTMIAGFLAWSLTSFAAKSWLSGSTSATIDETPLVFLGVPRMVAGEIAALDLSPIALIVLLLVFYAILGGVLEGMSSIVMTLPITLPLVQAAGFDKIWFGVFLVIVVEMAQITPPVGFNLFVIQGMTGERIGRIASAALPFFLIMVGPRAAHHLRARGRDLPPGHDPARELKGASNCAHGVRRALLATAFNIVGFLSVLGLAGMLLLRCLRLLGSKLIVTQAMS